MKSLLLLRHAKAENAQPDASDFERALTEEGMRQASKIGAFIKGTDLSPDVVITSTAPRARQTTQLILEALKNDLEPRLDQRLYDASAEQLRQIMVSFRGDASVLLLVGHNPSIEQLVGLLTGQWVSLGTANMAHIDVSDDEYRLVSIVSPANIS